MHLQRLNPQVFLRLDELAQEYSNAVPFPHVVIDDFFDPAFCDQLIDQFPPFEQGCAINEHGALGGKSTCENVRDLGDAYVGVDDLLRSEEFLKAVSRMTGIQDLLYDPDYVGGGTHENRLGQELDPHVDFNFHPKTGWHRRLNAIVYLNPEWEEGWGGEIELHQDPWRPDEDRVKSVLPVKNRCVLFETSERSWHGFRAIRPPAHRNGISRRSFAVYLYTRDRPVEQTAAPHATVYVERPLPATLQGNRHLAVRDAELVPRLLTRRTKHIERLIERERFFEEEARGLVQLVCDNPGLKLSSEDAESMRALVRLQDELLQALYRREKAFTWLLARLQRVVADLPEPKGFPLVGAAELAGEVEGFWEEDRWASATLSVPLRATGPIESIELRGFLPEQAPTRITLKARVGPWEAETEIGHGAFKWPFAAPIPQGEATRFTVLASPTWTPRIAGLGTDERELSYVLTRISAA